MKKLIDFDNYVQSKSAFDTCEEKLIALRNDREKVAAQLRLANMGTTQIEAIDLRDLRARLGAIEEEIQLHERTVEPAHAALEKAIGDASLEICRERLPQFEKHIKEMLGLLEKLCAANDRIRNLRSGLEGEGVQTASIPYCEIHNIGSWNNREQLGMAQLYRNSQQFFPGIKDAVDK